MQDVPPRPTLLMTPSEVAEKLQMSRSWVIDQIRNGHLPALKLGNRVRIQRKTFERFDPRKSRQRYTCIPATAEVGPGVYFVLAPTLKLIKIGCSRNLRHRLIAIQTASPEELEFVAMLCTDRLREAEKWFHRRFAKSRIRFEWFSIDKDQAASAIQELKALWNLS